MAKRNGEPAKAKPAFNQEAEVERLARLSPDALADADLEILTTIRKARKSLRAIDVELAECKDRRKARLKALEEALVDADRHIDARQLALNLLPA